MTIWMDVATALAWNRPPVGIVRTELECARQVIAYNDPSRFSLCYYDKKASEFRRLSKDQYERLRQLLSGVYSPRISNDYTNIIATVKTLEENDAKGISRLLLGAKQLVYNIDPVLNECIRGWIYDRRRPQNRVTIEFRSGDVSLYSKAADQFRPDLFDAGMSDGYCSFEIPIHEIAEQLKSANASTIQIFAQTKKPQLIGELVINSDALARIAEVSAIREGEPLLLGSSDVYVTAGLDWDYKDFSEIYRKKKERGFRVVGFCYDLIPVKYPHWCVGDVASFFSRYFVDLSWCADHIVCISECSRKDYEQFAAVAGVPEVATSVVRLGSNLKKPRTDAVIGAEVAKIAKTKYLLFVSTIERRKNHEVLYRAYTRLVEKGVSSLPSLVFVGMQGWGVAEFFADISLDPRVKGLIHNMNNVTDDELNVLYRNAMFTLFPSLYEGWGLPVAEALTHGKYCLASNQGAIPEIAGNLIDYLDPWCVQDWVDRIEFLIGNPSFLAERERQIRSNFTPDRWSVCADQILSAAEMRVVAPEEMVE
jgi:glycosyltransferase involved in cell wall biosynthesis